MVTTKGRRRMLGTRYEFTVHYVDWLPDTSRPGKVKRVEWDETVRVVARTRKDAERLIRTLAGLDGTFIAEIGGIRLLRTLGQDPTVTYAN